MLGRSSDDFPLAIGHLRWRMERLHRDSEAVTLLDDAGTLARASYGEIAERVDRLAGALRRLGIQPGDRVGSLLHNRQEQLEAYLAVPCSGAVLHTVNARLSAEQIAWTIDDAGDRVLIVDAELADRVAEIVPRLRTVEHVIVTGEPYEALLAGQQPGFDWPELPERTAAALCYTSGTTGQPKGVLYSHRAIVLQALAGATVDAFGIGAADRVLAVVPMFHVLGWGLPYVCAMVGADLILPGPRLQAEHLTRLVEGERATYACGVPTIWVDVLRHAEPGQLETLRRVACGGSAVPPELMRAFEQRHGVEIVQAWGMTECLACTTMVPAGERDWEHRASVGRAVPFVQPRIVDADGAELPWDGESAGELQVRGPGATRSYLSGTESQTDDGWLRTGDVATLDRDGWIRIVDRLKDVIKSGGEWVSSLELEAGLSEHPAVREAAVIGRPDERWGERPVACVVLDAPAEPVQLRAWLAGRLERWQVPDDFALLDELPHTSVGKLDKKALRRRLEAGELEVVAVPRDR